MQPLHRGVCTMINTSKWAHFGLIIYLKGYDSDLKIVRRSTFFIWGGTQDFNNELEQKIMSVLEFLISFKEIKVWKDNYSEPFWLSDIKRKRKNLFKNARRWKVQGYSKDARRWIRRSEKVSRKKKICRKIF